MNTDRSKPEQDRSTFGPEPGTLHTTDPQEHMQGPVSTSMHGIEKAGEKSDREDPVQEKSKERPEDRRP